jgi:hypothetical protein
MKYDYLENLKEDIKNYMEENDIQEVNDSLYDDLFLEDSVTGNASGSYYCNAWKAEEAISHNLELLQEALDMFGDSYENALERGAEYCDVTIRCYLLGQALEEVKEEL